MTHNADERQRARDRAADAIEFVGFGQAPRKADLLANRGEAEPARLRRKKRSLAPRVVADITRYGRPLAVHGVRRSYVAGCRCEPCTAAQRDYDRLRRDQRHGR